MVGRLRGLLAFFLAGVLTLSDGAALAGTSVPQADPFDRIEAIYELVKADHKDGADLERFVEGAIRGGLESLEDPYTRYFSTTEWGQFQEQMDGRFVGIGVYLEQVGEYLVVRAPIPGGPAEKAGLKAGDRFLTADGKPLRGASLEAAQQLLRGEAGSQVRLTMERPGEGRTFEVTLTRQEIDIPLVEYRMLEGGVGYLILAQFSDSAPAEVALALDKLKKQGATRLVLDLRQNPGGYVDSALAIAEGWVPKGESVLIEVDRQGETLFRSRGSHPVGLPTVVLVDGDTASAAEILAGAIQEHGGRLVGSRTFGKGTIQGLVTLEDGAGVKVTVAEYLTGGRRKVDRVGLEPDVAVEPAADLGLSLPLALTRKLEKGQVGLDVLEVQHRLAYLGYAVPLHGGFDEQMLLAVNQFRQAQGLAEAPVVDEGFVRALEEAIGQRLAAEAQRDPVLEKALELLAVKH